MRYGLVFLAAALVAGCGGDGKNALLRLTQEPPGASCESGGTKVDSGIDDDDSGSLEDGEVGKTTYLCNGAPGAAGQDGTDGSSGTNGTNGSKGDEGDKGDTGDKGDKGDKGDAGDDGKSVLIDVATEPPGENCASGGTRLQTGLDTDGSGALEPAEVTATAYVCNGEDGGSSQVVGFQLLAKFTLPGGPIAEIVSASADGTLIGYTSSVFQSVGFVDLSDPAHPVDLGTVDVSGTVPGGEPTSLVLRPDGLRAAVAVKDTSDPVASADPGALVIVDVANRTVVGQIALGVGPDSIHLAPDGETALVAIEDEEDADNNAVAQSRPGKLQIVTIDWNQPASSTIVDVELTPDVGHNVGDPQPEYIDVTADGATAIVSLQENNLVAVIDVPTGSVIRYIDMGTSEHARADMSDDGEVVFSTPFTGFREPDTVCLLDDGRHFVTANEGDTFNDAYGPGLSAGGRGFSIFDLEGGLTYDSGDAAEWLAIRAGAYPDGRSDARGIEIEGCAAATYGRTQLAFLLVERNSTLVVLDASDPANPVMTQVLGAPMRPEGAATIPSRGLLVVGGEGDGTGGGIWIYRAVHQPDEMGMGPDVYDTRSGGVPYSALGALAFDPQSGLIVATPDNAFDSQRLWWFWPDHGARRMQLVSEMMLRSADGEQLTGYDPEGIGVNPEGGFVIASEGVAGNGAGGSCVGTVTSNRLLFFDAGGRLDPAYGVNGVVDLPCGAEPNAIDWATVRGNGWEGVAVVDTDPDATGGLKVYAALQRALTTDGQNTRIAEYDVDTGVWNFWFYTLDANPGGNAGNTFLSEILHVTSDRFAVIERDQGWAGDAGNKTIRTFRLSSGTANDILDPVEKETVVDLLDVSFRFDQEKLEGLALGGGALWVTNDNDLGEAANFFLKLDPALLGLSSGGPPTVPGQGQIVINEVASNPTDFVELYNRSGEEVDLSGWKLVDDDPTHEPYELPAGTTIGAGGYLLLRAGDALQLPWGLGGADGIFLSTPWDVPQDSYTWAAHVTSASRCPDGTGTVFWAPTAATPGAVNDCTPPDVPGQDDIVVNEVNSSGDDFVELFNNGAADVDVSGWKITDSDPTHVYTLPAGTTVPAGGLLLVNGDGSLVEPHLTFGLGSTDSVIVYTPYDVRVDQHDWVGHVASAGRCPDGTGDFQAMTASPGDPNTCP